MPFRNQSVCCAGLTARINRTEYYDQVKRPAGADYWLDVDKFALRDNGNFNPLLFRGHGEAAASGKATEVRQLLLPTRARHRSGAVLRPSWFR